MSARLLQIVTPTALVVLMQAAPVWAQSYWAYDPASSMATAFCAARAMGKSMEEAKNAANTAGVAAFRGGIGAMIGSSAQLRELGQRAGYLTVKMCPELISR